MSVNNVKELMDFLKTVRKDAMVLACATHEVPCGINAPEYGWFKDGFESSYCDYDYEKISDFLPGEKKDNRGVYMEHKTEKDEYRTTEPLRYYLAVVISAM